MVNYNLMNKIIEEQGVCERAIKEEDSYIEHEAHEYISKIESQSEEDASWQNEYYQ